MASCPAGAEPVARFSLPVPPGANNLFVERRDRKGRAKTSGYEAWIREAMQYVMIARASGGIPAGMAPLKHVRVEWRLPFDYRRDVDNTKPLMDLLKRAGIVVDDRWVDHNEQIRVATTEPLVVTVWQLT